MRDCRCSAAFATESLLGYIVRLVAWVKYFDSYIAMQVRIEGFENNSHSAATDNASDLKMLKLTNISGIIRWL